MTEPKKRRTLPTFELIYWPSIPGRGEFIRLLLEAARAPYTDVSNATSSGVKAVTATTNPDTTLDADGNPPVLCVPALRVPGAGKDGKTLLIHQVPNIIQYVAPLVGLAPDDEVDRLYANQIMLTALDVTNEAHNTHHPVSVRATYEDQKEEAARYAEEFKRLRIAKFFGYFERILKGNEEHGKGRYLVGDRLSYADTTVWQAVDGIMYAFPNEVEARKKDFPLLFDTFHPGFKQEKSVADYLSSPRRKAYSSCVWRNYPELDRQ